MSELTREYLDKKLDKLATKEDLKKLEVSLKLHTEKEVADLATMVAEGFAGVDKRFDEIEKKLDVRKQVEGHDRRIYQIEQALNINVE